jgi:hypothetical protein
LVKTKEKEFEEFKEFKEFEEFKEFKEFKEFRIALKRCRAVNVNGILVGRGSRTATEHLQRVSGCNLT